MQKPRKHESTKYERETPPIQTAYSTLSYILSFPFSLVALPIILRHAREFSERVVLLLRWRSEFLRRREAWRSWGRRLTCHASDELGLCGEEGAKRSA